MLNFFQRITSRRNDEAGASAVEYGLLVAAIAAIIVVIVFALGKLVQGGFTKTCEGIKTGTNDATTSCTP